MKLDIALWQHFRNLISPNFANPKEFTVAIPNIIESLDRDSFAFLKPLQASETVEAAVMATEKAAEFADIANCVSADPLLWQFDANGTQLSDIYSDIINEALFLDDDRVREKVAKTKIEFNNLNTHKNGDFDFVSTLCKPNELYKFDSSSWRKTILTGAELTALEQQARSSVTTEEYKRADNDIITPDLDILSISFEYVVATIERQWFDEELLKSSAWQYHPVLHGTDRTLSKGFDEYGGDMPAFATQLIFTRNVTVDLKPDSPKNIYVISQIILGQFIIGRNMFKSIPQNTNPNTVTKISFSNLTQKDKSVLTTQYKVKLQNSKLFLPTKVGVGTKILVTPTTTGVKVTGLGTTAGKTDSIKIGKIDKPLPIGLGTPAKPITVLTGSVTGVKNQPMPSNVVVVNSSVFSKVGRIGVLSEATADSTAALPKAKVISDNAFSRMAWYAAAKPVVKEPIKNPTSSIALPVRIIVADWRNTVFINPNPMPQKIISGKLLDNATGQPMVNFRLDLLSGDSMVLSTQTDNNGLFKFGVSNDGDYKIKINNLHFTVKAPSVDNILRFDRTNVLPDEPPIFLHAVVLKRLPKLPNPVLGGHFI
jgi:hypothetical protein